MRDATRADVLRSFDQAPMQGGGLLGPGECGAGMVVGSW